MWYGLKKRASAKVPELGDCGASSLFKLTLNLLTVVPFSLTTK